MELIDQVKAICERLAPLGWDALMKRHGLDISAANLEAELHRDISKTIDRRVPGFMDFIGAGFSAIHPYNPSMSLLYHALASPNVHPGPGNTPLANSDVYPSLEDLDIIENYIFSCKHPAGGVFNRNHAFFETHFKKENLVIAVFAYQYKPGSKTVHGRYADICYSRTGVARMGTDPPQYIGSSRSFWPVPPGQPHQFSVMAARYAAFIAEIRPIAVRGEVMSAQNSDRDNYVFPLHKLFSGSSCIDGLTVPVFSFEENHVSEKLRLLFRSQGIASAFDLEAPPFKRSSGKGLNIKRQKCGSSILLAPKETKALVEPAMQAGHMLNFKVPPGTEHNDRRYSTSLQVENTGRFRNSARIGPEYANIRFELKDGVVVNLFDEFDASQEAGYLRKINLGGYDAVVFSDNSCDGCIEIKFSKDFGWIDTRFPAYSLIAAPDFFPLCDQSDIANWEADNEIKDQFNQGGTDPLFTTRRFINPVIDSALNQGVSAFDFLNKQKIKTTTAMVSMSVLSSDNPDVKSNERQVSWLTDAASGFFAPGWDVSLVTVEEFDYDFLSTAGLGSPFPEDTKLCAALNSFWPAVAPDASRTFITARVAPKKHFTTALPLTDDELGYHPNHPDVLSRKQKPSTGWDGEQGPFFEMGFSQVNYCSIDRSDYTANMLKKLFTVEKLSLIDAAEWINRMIALRNCIFVLPPAGDHVSRTKLSLISVQKIDNWVEQSELDRADPLLSGPGFVMDFALLNGEEQLTDDPKRRTQKVEESYLCQLSERFLFWRNRKQEEFQPVNRGTIPLKW
jgi:hypothetical protein